MKPGDLVRIKPMYSRDRFGGRAHMNLFQHPLDFENYPERVIVGTFTSDQVGTVFDFTVKYDSKHCIERKDVKVLVGECMGWIEDKILCKVDE